VGFFGALGVEGRRLVFSSDTSEEQGRQFGKGRGTVDCCYPVKCIAGHYGELVFGQKEKLDILFSPMIYNLPSFLSGHVARTLTCPRVMAAPENIKAGFIKERDVFAEQGIRYVAPFVSLDEPKLVPKQLWEGLQAALPDLTPEETRRAVDAGYRALSDFGTRLRRKGREVLEWCARENRPCLLVLARPYHMDPGIGHEIEVDLQAYGYPVLWAQYFPTDPDLMEWAFGEDIRAARPSTSATCGRRPTRPTPTRSCGARRRPRGCPGWPAWCASPATSAGWTSPPTRRSSRSSSGRARSSSRSRTSTRPSRPAR
jgi:predicted nucleotide-binding protein (sugar kinase/HSP70/actin superfamily)